MSSTKRYIWLDAVKILACFLVIINHSHGYMMQNGLTDTVATFDAIFFSVSKAAVPLFVMSTGYLILQKETTWKKTFLRVLRILVPLICISALFYIRANGITMNILGFFKQFLTNPLHVSLWYLYMLIGVYLIAPYITKIIKASSLKDLVILVLLFLLLPAVISFVSLVCKIKVSSYFMSAFLPPVIGYLVAGCALTKIALKRRYLIGSIIVYVISVLFFVLSIVITYHRSGKVTYMFDSWTALPVVCASLSVFYLFRYIMENKVFKEKTGSFISQISGTTFGIYLIHIFLLSKIANLEIMKAVYLLHPVIGTIVTQVACFVIGSIIVFIAKKIPIVKWFL